MTEQRRTRRPQEPALLDIFEGRVLLDGEVIARTGLHIGAGTSGNPIGTNSPVVRDGLGRPMIPGSSLKGVLRSAAEALLRHFPRPRDTKADYPPLWTCDVVGNDPCVDHDRLSTFRDLLPENPEPEDLRFIAEEAWKESCTVCRLFGSMAMAGRARFPDLLLVEDQAPVMEVRNGVGIDRDKGQAADGVLYDFEAVPPDNRFGLQVVVDNYDDFEIGLLLYLFDELHRGSLVLGGKTTRGLGQVSIKWHGFEEVRLNTNGGSAENPFANLLKRDRFQDEEQKEPSLELPVPHDGDADLWRKLAERLDALETVDRHAVSKVCQELGVTKAKAASQLGADSGRQAFQSLINLLVAAGRLVERDGDIIPKAKIEEQRAAALDGARTPAWLLPHYERFVGAMDALWQEAA